MTKERKEVINVRIISSVFTMLALAVFKPFGLEAWQWQAWVHLLAILSLGIISCMVTEAILKYIVRMPHSVERGVSYIIRRNLWFQCINTPLVALSICLYRHFVMSSLVESNKLSFSNFFETLLIIAFLSFAIGLYWRFKFRSRFLAAELEETRLLNEQLKNMQNQVESVPVQVQEQQTCASVSDVVTLTGTTNETVTLRMSDLLYIEAVGNYVKVCWIRDGQVRTDMLRATSKQMEEMLQPYPSVVRCHRAFLVNLAQVEQIVSKAGTMLLNMMHSHEAIPVSRSNMPQIRSAISGE